MGVATFEGVVENGQIRLPATVRLPERTKVYVIVPDVEVQPVAYIGSPRLVQPEHATDFQKEVLEEPSDADL
ncbi:MAG: hypothetical protein AB1671_06815 [Thermodesulfobacteriota bacterium]|jgi:hypothetical protein